MLTENEKTFILKITRKSNFTCEELNFNLTAEENGLYDCCCWECWSDAKDLAKEHGYNVNVVKGLLGSLTKKGYIAIEDATECGDEVLINKDRFEKIKADL